MSQLLSVLEEAGLDTGDNGAGDSDTGDSGAGTAMRRDRSLTGGQKKTLAKACRSYLAAAAAAARRAGAVAAAKGAERRGRGGRAR